MSLRHKFILLLLLLGGAVAVNLGTVLWSISFLEKELAAPLRSFQEILKGLSEVKRELGDIHGSLVSAPNGSGGPGPMVRAEPGPEPRHDETDRLAFEAAAAKALAGLDLLESNESYQLRAGLSTTRNLRTRVNEALDATRQWYRTGDAGDDPLRQRRKAIGDFYDLHELIERIEQQNLRELESTVTYNADLRWLILAILGASALVVALAIFDAIILIQRLVLRPVARLRSAADRLAAGDFAYRIEVRGRDEIAQLSGEVNHMAGTIARMQAERIERERLAAVGEVVRRIVHNLRNPLAGIRGLAEYTRGELEPESDLREAQDRIMQTVDRFEGWLSGMLRATRPLEVVPETVEVRPWLAGVVELHRAAAESRGVRLALDTTQAPQTASFDPRHLEQAVIALVTNAIEASPRGGTVAVSTLSDGGRWQILVSDEGAGVPVELREQVFRPYFTTKKDGSGIGLAVAHQVIAQHGGRISVGEPASDGQFGPGRLGTPSDASGIGPGAVFTVALPLAGPAEPGQAGPWGGGRGENSGHRG